MKGYEVRRITTPETKDFILNKHYAQRMPSVSWAFGLFKEDQMKAVMTIGKPASNSLCVGILGEEYKSIVYELNRLVADEGLERNALSYFVANAIKLIKEKIVIVSYADTGMGHNGYIYQATNFIYTGKTKGRTDKWTEGNKHSRHYKDENDHLRKVRTEKHRYVFFHRCKGLKKKMNYPVLPYPKGDNRKYVLGERMKTKVINKKTGEVEYY